MIRHPGIIEIYDCDVHRNGRAYIVMEYLEGETLAKRLERTGALPWPAACRIARRVSDAIGAAHRAGIVHRDVKPDNVFLLSHGAWPAAGEVKVLDFGLAKLLAGNFVGLAGTVQGSLVGSPTYMSPEQCRGEPIDHRCDIYSLGCVLFELVAGRPPFIDSRVRDVLEAHTVRHPPALGSLVPDAPAWLVRLVARERCHDPRQRPRSIDEVSAIWRNVALLPPGHGDALAGGAGRSAPRERRTAPERFHRSGIYTRCFFPTCGSSADEFSFATTDSCRLLQRHDASATQEDVGKSDSSALGAWRAASAAT